MNATRIRLHDCLDTIHTALDGYDMYKQNYDMLMCLPMVKELVKRNKALMKENKRMKVALSMVSIRKCNCGPECACTSQEACNCGDECLCNQKENCGKASCTKLEQSVEDQEKQEDQEDEEVIVIKQEKVSKKENIVYEIIEEASTKSDEEEVEVEVEEEEEEGEEEEEVEVEEEETVEVEVEVEETGEVEVEVEEEETEEVEVEVEEEETEEVEVEVEEEELEEVEVEVEEEEEDEEFTEVVINGVTYYTSDEANGKIYKVTEDGELGDEVGVFVNGVASIPTKKVVKKAVTKK